MHLLLGSLRAYGGSLGETVREAERQINFLHRLAIDERGSERAFMGESTSASQLTPDDEELKATRRRKSSFHKLIPVSVWLSDEHDRATIIRPLSEFLDYAGLESIQAFPPERGSWFQRFIYQTRVALSNPVLRSRAEKAERAIELKMLTKSQAAVNLDEATAVSKLIDSLATVSDAVIQVGSLLLIKARGVLYVRNLTIRELKYLDENPEALRDPTAILLLLQATDAADAAQQDTKGSPRRLNLPEAGRG